MNSAISGFLYLFGALLFFTACYYGLYEGIIEPNKAHHKFSDEDKYQLIAGGVALVFSIGFIWSGALLDTLSGIHEELMKSKIERNPPEA